MIFLLIRIVWLLYFLVFLILMIRLITRILDNRNLEGKPTFAYFALGCIMALLWPIAFFGKLRKGEKRLS